MRYKWRRGFLIGRFQPLHNGHVYLIKKALEKVETLIIGIGSTNKEDEDNPFSFTLREKMLQDFIEQENLAKRIIKIVPIKDIPDDDEWLSYTLKRIGKVDVVVGNNDWVNSIFTAVDIPVMRVDFYKRYILEGRKIRTLMEEKKSWEDRVPQYIANHVNNLKN